MIPLKDDNPTEITPWITVLLIIACTVIFFWELSLGPKLEHAVLALGATPAVVLGHAPSPSNFALIPEWGTLFTSMFMHGGWMHLIGNMLYLWIFGDNIEDSMGHWRFIVFYLLCGIAADAVHVFLNATSTIPTIGASGAISGVLGAYLILHPHNRVLIAIPLGFFIHTARIPAIWVLAFWFLLQLYNAGMVSKGQGGVAFDAHIGGFVAGMLLIPFFRKRRTPQKRM